MKKGILKRQLESLADKNTLRFHMPGHKGRGSGDLLVPRLDYTEVPGSDNLHQPTGVILEVQKKLAAVYGAEESSILVNGTTTGLQSAILGCFSEGDKILVPTNCHRSVYGGLALGGVEGVFFAPACDDVLGFAARITPAQVEAQLALHPEVKGMLLVSPTYYGTTSDVRAIAEILHRQQKILIVDEAHGAHLHFSERLPEDSVAAGADIVVQSTHKLLGAFTQSSLLHFQGSLADRDRVRRMLAMLQSSSPSYPLMMGVEAAVDDACLRGKQVFDAIADAWDTAQKHWQAECIILYGQNQPGYDKSKWLFGVGGGLGGALEAQLYADFNIQCELSWADGVLALTGIGTEVWELEALTEAIYALDKTLPRGLEAPAGFEHQAFVYDQVKTLRQAIFSGASCAVPLDEAEGALAADFIIPYPPGIPAVLPGGRLHSAVIDRLLAMKRRGEAIVGLDDAGRIQILKEK
ncbi:MAG: aminotransferase class I/II-fold pyridoxal phosphate-dependent enzyme [Eubacterium sp.]|nr:aminotransferase class I/II-fold pyridoxal phosphate-dependent enzyme [Eubacterium sp.]